MPTNWRKPFPRDALVITEPDSEKLRFVRPSEMQNTPIEDWIYQELEDYRKAWLEFEVNKEREQERLRIKERNMRGERLNARDSRSAVAEGTLKKLSQWKKFVDPPRWEQLGKWIDAHPQRWKDIDNVLDLLEGYTWDNPYAGLESPPSPPKPHKGRPKGVASSAQTRVKLSDIAKKRWEQRRAEGWENPTKGVKRKVTLVREEPYGTG